MAGLRALANRHLKHIVSGDANGARMPITIKNTKGKSADLYGLTTDIYQLIDRDTGQLVSGRTASVAIVMDDLTQAGLSIPIGIVDKNKKPWVVIFDDIDGNAYTFKVFETNPDRAAGLVICMLEAYKDAA